MNNWQQNKIQEDLIDDDFALVIEREFHAQMQYEKALHKIVSMNFNFESYDEMRIELDQDLYSLMRYNHKMKLLWVIDQWEEFFNETGSRFSD